MSNPFISRLEKLLYGSSSQKEKQENEHTHTGDVITCTKERRIEQMPSELITSDRLTANWAGGNDVIDLSNLAPNPVNRNHTQTTVSLKELIAARIAQTEHVNGPANANRRSPYAKDDKNGTLANIDSLAASIYFWSPYASWNNKGEQKSIFMPGNLKGKACAFNTGLGDNSSHRNKDTFISFSQPALIMVAKNPETPPDTLKWLAAHYNAEIRKAVAKNENADYKTLVLLSGDADDNVKSSVLDNVRISKDLAAQLASNKSLSVSTKARNIYYQLDVKSREVLPLNKEPNEKERNQKQIMQTKRDFLKTVAVSTDDPQRHIVKSPLPKVDWHVRMLVAGDPNTTAEVLWQLASHPVSQVKRKLVDKYNCLLETVVNLKGHKTLDAKNSLAASETRTIN